MTLKEEVMAFLKIDLIAHKKMMKEPDRTKRIALRVAADKARGKFIAEQSRKAKAAAKPVKKAKSK